MVREEVWLVNLDPTVGTEIRKMRPAVIMNMEEMSAALSAVLALN